MYAHTSLIQISTTGCLLEQHELVSRRVQRHLGEFKGGMPSYMKYVAACELLGAVQGELDSRYRLVYGDNLGQ